MPNPFFVGGTIPMEQFHNQRSALRRAAGRSPAGNPAPWSASRAAARPRCCITERGGKTSGTVRRERREAAVPVSRRPNAARGLRPGALLAMGAAAVEPITEGSPDLHSALHTCGLEGYGTFVLERLLAQLQAAGWWLVLLLDEFDVLLHHPALNQAEFYGGCVRWPRAAVAWRWSSPCASRWLSSTASRRSSAAPARRISTSSRKFHSTHSLSGTRWGCWGAAGIISALSTANTCCGSLAGIPSCCKQARRLCGMLTRMGKRMPNAASSWPARISTGKLPRR